MTRATLLATTAAILIPLGGVLAQETETETDPTETNNLTETVTDTTDEATDEAAEATEEVGDAVGTAIEETGEATEEAADAVTPEAESDATAEADGGAAGTMTVADVTGMTVIDAAGEDVGDVDMVVSQGDGTAAVIGVGGFLGLGERSVAIPMGDLQMNGEGQLELSGYTAEDLGRLPEFEDDGAQVLEDEQPVPDLG